MEKKEGEKERTRKKDVPTHQGFFRLFKLISVSKRFCQQMRSVLRAKFHGIILPILTHGYDKFVRAQLTPVYRLYAYKVGIFPFVCYFQCSRIVRRYSHRTDGEDTFVPKIYVCIYIYMMWWWWWWWWCVCVCVCVTALMHLMWKGTYCNGNTFFHFHTKKKTHLLPLPCGMLGN